MEKRITGSALLISMAILALCTRLTLAHEDGDALQLQTYIVETSADRPNVLDGLLSKAGAEGDWKSAYARQATFRAGSGLTRTATLFFSNDNDSLYLAVAIPSSDNGNGQGFFMYFDLNNNGVLDGTPSARGEYAISSTKSGSLSSFKEYSWNGTAWIENTIRTPGIKEAFSDGGAGGSHVFNFEVQLPFLSSAINAGQAFFNTSTGNEVGVMITLTPPTGVTGHFYWDGAGTSITNASAWGELTINTAMASPRRLSSLYAKSYIPTVSDGKITDDPNWKYAFDKTVVFTDFAGNKLTNCRLLIKQSAAGMLYFGAKINDNVSNNGDYFQIYFDQGGAGGNLNYILNSGSSRNDDAVRISGSGALTDFYFNAATGSPTWSADGTLNGTGGAHFIASEGWEFEIAKPMTSADANDLSITSGQMVGILFRYYDADNSRDYWWSGTINSDLVKLDLSNNNYNALGWAELVTGGPFVQPLYPAQSDIISGTYPLMLYAEDEDGVNNIDSVDFRITDLNDNIIVGFSPATSLVRVSHDTIGLWIATFNTKTASTPDGDYNIIFRVKDDDGISVNVPVRIAIQNTGMVGGPTVTVTNLFTGSVANGDTLIRFNVNPSGSSYLLVADSIQMRLDNDPWVTVDSAPPATGGTGLDTLHAGSLTDGVHTLRIRAKDSGNRAWGYSELIIFNVDNAGEAPAVTITAPSDLAVKSGRVPIVFTATAMSGRTIDSVEIAVDGFNWRRTSTALTDTLTTTIYPDGTHLVQVRATDNRGRTGYSQPIAIVINNTPTVTISSALADSLVRGTVIIPFTALAVAPSTVISREISLDGGAWRATSGTATDTLDTRALSDESHTVQVRVTDSNNRIGYSQIVSFTVANVPIVAITAPRADSVVSGTLVITFTATPATPSTIAATQISIDGGAWRSTSTLSADTLSTLDLTDGSHLIQVRATDVNGKTGNSAVVKIEVRNAPSVQITSPRADSIVSGVVTVGFSADAIAPATIVSREIHIDGALRDTSSTDSTYIWTTTELTDGNHTVQVKVVDSQGKSGVSEIVTVSVKNSPTVVISAPQGGEVVSGTDTLRFTATPVAPATIAKREVLIDGNTWTDSLVGAGTFILKTTGWADGTHSVKVRATDSNGRTGYSAVVLFIVQNAPKVTISAPDASDTLSGLVTIRFTAIPVAPAVIAQRAMSIDGGNYVATASDSTAQLDTRLLADGSHLVRIKVTDNGDRVGFSEERLYVIDNNPPVSANPLVIYPEATAPSTREGSSVLVTVLVRDLIAGLRADSGVVLVSDAIGAAPATYVMRDDGTHGDKVAGDNVFSAQVTVGVDSTGPIGYSVITTDRLGNTVTLKSVIQLDNTPPRTSFVVEPSLENGTGSLVGQTYASRLLVKGTYSDKGGSGIARAFVSVKNDSGNHVFSSPGVLSHDSIFSLAVNLVPGLNTIMLYAADRAGNADSTIAQVTYLEPKASAMIGRGGATLTAADGASVTIPENTLLSPVEVTIRRVDPVEQRKPLDPNLKLLYVAHDFGPDGSIFRKPVTLTLSYTNADLDRDQDGVRDVDQAKLVIVYWDGSTWRTAGPTVVDTLAKRASVQVNHFTIFDLAESNASLPSELVAYWSANPVKASSGASFNYNVPVAGTVGLRILDMSGDLVYELIRPGKRIVPTTVNSSDVWRGQNTAGQFAGVGMYVYVFTYKNATDNKTTIIRKPLGLLR